MSIYRTLRLSARLPAVLTGVVGQDRSPASISGRKGRFGAAKQHFHSQKSQLARTHCSAPDGVTGKVCNWVESVQLQMVPAEIRNRVKHLVLDGMACLMTGAKLPWSKEAGEALLEIDGSGQHGDCTIFGWEQVRNTTYLCHLELTDST